MPEPLEESDPELEHKRPWAIHPGCKKFSLILATLNELGFIAGAIIAFLSGNRNPGMIFLVVAWPIFYFIIYGIAHLIAQIDQRGPAMGQFPAWYRDLSPRQAQWLLNRFYTSLPNLGLIAFPVVCSFFAILTVWGAATGRINP